MADCLWNLMFLVSIGISHGKVTIAILLNRGKEMMGQTV